jgi:S-DNA-T family DNA segregation ATPase FtsK/SpoIIIE
MNGRVKTSKVDEQTIDQLADLLSGGGGIIGRGREKWRVLRLALAVSMRLPVNPKDAPKELTQRLSRDGSEYRLQQVTGEGRRGGTASDLDLTDTLRAMLGVLHQRDLFAPIAPDGDNDELETLLEFHLHRGLSALQRERDATKDWYSALARLLAPPSEEAKSAEANADTARIVAGFLELNVIVQPRGAPVVGPRLTHYALFVPDPHDYDRILAGLNKLAFVLGLREDTLTVTQGALGAADEAKVLTLAVPRPKESWSHPGYDALRRGIEGTSCRLPLALGVTPLGAPFVQDLAEAPHLLLGGSTGSGKSVALHGLLCGLLTVPQDRLRLHLCDAKGTELADYKGVPQLHGDEVATRPEDIHAQVKALVEHMDARFERLKAQGHRDHYAAWDAGQRDEPSRVLVIDELTDLLMERPQAEEPLVRLAQKGRAAGVHLILATQRPDARTLTGNLRTNIPARVALAVQRASESMIILGAKGAEALLPPGDMLVTIKSAAPARAHAYDIRPDDVASAVRVARNRTSR